jgi:hypothetical protein
MPRKFIRVSMSTPSVPAWPDRLVPPERNVTGTPCRVATRSAEATSSPFRATTTAWGRSRKWLASWLIRARSRGLVLTWASPRIVRSSRSTASKDAGRGAAARAAVELGWEVDTVMATSWVISRRAPAGAGGRAGRRPA